jgi:hypothetical protein
MYHKGHGRCIIFLVDPSSIMQVSNTQFATHVTFYFNYICIFRVKNSLSTPPLFVYIGIVGFKKNHPHQIFLNPITMVVPCDATAAGLWQISQYPCGSIFGRVWPRVGQKDIM